MACAGGIVCKKFAGEAGDRARIGEEQAEGENTDVAGVTGDRGSLSESESVAEEDVDIERVRFIGVEVETSTPAVASRSLMSSRVRSKSLMCRLVSLAIAQGRYAAGRESLMNGRTWRRYVSTSKLRACRRWIRAGGCGGCCGNDVCVPWPMGRRGDRMDMSSALGERRRGAENELEEEATEEALERWEDKLERGEDASGANESCTSWMTRRRSSIHCSERSTLRIDPSMKVIVTSWAGSENVTSSMT